MNTTDESADTLPSISIFTQSTERVLAIDITRESERAQGQNAEKKEAQ
jgi:hypothetical protein